MSQALHLNNGVTLNDKLRDKTSSIAKWLAAKDPRMPRSLTGFFSLALTRKPTPQEMKQFLSILGEATKESAVSRREAVEDLVWAILTGREFLFNH